MAKSRPTSRRRLTPDERRLELLEAGERVVRRMGMSARVEDIVLEAGAAKGTFYVYFDTWDDFLLALRERAFAHLEADFEAFVGDCTDWPSLVGGLPALFIDMTLSLEGLHVALFHGLVAHAPVVDSRFDVIARLERLLAQGVRDKALEAPDAAATSRFLFGLLHEAADLVEQGHGRERIAGVLRRLLLNALKVRRVRLRERQPRHED